jgi:hypothetical protein
MLISKFICTRFQELGKRMVTIDFKVEWKRYLLLGLSLGKILKKGFDVVKLYIKFSQLTT